MNELNPIENRSDFTMSGYAEEPESSKTSWPVQRLLWFLRKYWWLPVVSLLLASGAGIGFVDRLPPMFVSNAYMWEPVKLRLPQGELYDENDQTFQATQTELLQSRAIQDLTLARLSAVSTNGFMSQGDQPLPVEITVSGGTKSSIVEIQAKAANAAYIQTYLNTLMIVYLEYKRDIRKVVSGDTLASITEQVQLTEHELKTEQDAFMAFQQTNNLLIVQEEGTVAGNYLAGLKTKLSDLHLEDQELAAALRHPTNEATDMGGVYVSSEQAAVGGAPAARQTALNELEQLKIQRAQLSERLRPQHPRIVKLNADIANAEKMMESFHRQSRDQLAESRQALTLKIENTEASIQEWEARVLEAKSHLGEAERLKLNVERTQSVYDRLMLLMQNVGLGRNIDQGDLAILQPASPAKRIYKVEVNALGAAIMGGLGSGLGIILLMALRDDRFISLTEVSAKLGQAIVGEVPAVRDLDAAATRLFVEDGEQPHDYAESFRNLRSALFFMASEAKRPRVVLITSAQPHEGKSTVAVNLARTLALGGSRVVLIDGDLRKGALHKLLGLQAEPGLAEIIRQPGDMEKLIQNNSQSNLFFISRGGIAGNSGDQFLDRGFDEMVARLRQQFDYVLLDSRPVFAAADASTLAPKVDGTLFVVRSHFSSPKPTREALSLLYQRRARVLGVVFNQADPSASSYYYYKDGES